MSLPSSKIIFLLSSLFAQPLVANHVTDWNAQLLANIRTPNLSPGINPPKASRQMAMLNLALHDTQQAIENQFRTYLVYQAGPAAGASVDAAVHAAAYRLLQSLYTGTGAGNATVQANLTTLYNQKLALIPDSLSKEQGITWGESVATAMLNARAADGSSVAGSYTATPGPGVWEPTPPGNAAALLPAWGQVTPFGLVNVTEVRPQMPSTLTTAAYAAEFDQVKSLGSATSTSRTADQTQVALFWADGAGTETPPGHWIHIASDLAVARGQTNAESARMLALMSMSMADAAIAAWDAKYVYNYWRPITAIRKADTDGNPATEVDATWTPLIATPPFPEFVSGHSTFSRSAASVLAGFFGTDSISFTTGSDGLPGVTRSYAGFSAAADDAGISRIYGGIHFAAGNWVGQTMGNEIAKHNAKYYLAPVNRLSFALVNKVPGACELTLNVTPNVSYLIEASSDLDGWEILVKASSATNYLNFVDTNAPVGKRFYRARVAP